MKLYRLHKTQKLPITPEEAWEFFSDPRNLANITPKSLGFKITNKIPHIMYAGMIISYKIRPFLGIPVQWITEITHVEEPVFFIDQQRFGPYKFWHHQHIFTETAGGIEVEDVVHYALPFGPIGRLLHLLFVKRQLKKIFSHRELILKRKFT